MNTELTMLAWTIVLGLIQLLITAQFFTAANGLVYGMSPRDARPKPLSELGGRFERAFKNLMETFPFAAAAILIACVANRHNGYTIWGAQLYFWGRLAYLPLYAAGVPAIRTLAWLVSVLGIILVLLGAAFG
jgi:uncharacterized MAPEG superfamily protein